VVGVLVVPVVAIACHFGQLGHVDSVHSAGAWEFYCVQLDTEETTLEDALDALNAVLQHQAGWDSRPTVTLDEAFVECEDTVDRDLYKIEFYIHDTGDYGPCSVSCNDFQGAPFGDHPDYEKTYIHTAADRLDEDFVINHETGHALGLRDPTPSPLGDPEARTCRIWLDTDHDGSADTIVPVWSVMHAGYCPNVPINAKGWPSVFDFLSFDECVAQWRSEEWCPEP
jgi:hypothetical protein